MVAVDHIKMCFRNPPKFCIQWWKQLYCCPLSEYQFFRSYGRFLRWLHLHSAHSSGQAACHAVLPRDEQNRFLGLTPMFDPHVEKFLKYRHRHYPWLCLESSYRWRWKLGYDFLSHWQRCNFGCTRRGTFQEKTLALFFAILSPQYFTAGFAAN